MRRYLGLFSVPAAPRLIFGGGLGRLGLAGLDLSLLLAVRHATGSYATGGAAVAALTVASAASSIVQGRLMDRLGTRLVLCAGGFAAAAALVGLAVLLGLTGKAAPLIAQSALTGLLLPAIGPCLRGLWAAILPDADQRATAFAYESMAQDIAYVVGPAAVGVIIAAASPGAALLACASLVGAGALALARAQPVRPGQPTQAGAAPTAAAQGPIARRLAPGMIALVGAGGSIGAMEVSATALATDHGTPAAAGLLIGAFSVGSIVGSLLYGARAWKTKPARLLMILLLALAAGMGVTALASPLILAASALVLAGAPLAAAITTAFLLADRDMPAPRAFEAFAWLSIALSGGAAAGFALAGPTVEALGAVGGFIQAATTGLVGAVAVAFAGSFSGVPGFRGASKGQHGRHGAETGRLASRD